MSLIKPVIRFIKFDSAPEYIFSIVLERDENVIRWLRPAAGHFKIWWKAGCEYRPDFLVEPNDKIYIVKIKAKNRIQDEEVRLKKKQQSPSVTMPIIF